jgi:predicted nucleic acid-binding protein
VIVVVDASVALKWLHNEDGSREAASLLMDGQHLIAPDLIVPEVCNVTWKMVRRGMMSPAQQMAAVTRLPSMFDELAPTGPLAPRAAAISAILDHPAYDCFYLALAEQRSGILISADRRLINRLDGTTWQEMATDLRTVTLK